MLTSFKIHLNQEEKLYLLLSNFALDDPTESGGAGIQMHSGFFLMNLYVWRQQKYHKKFQKLSYMLEET